TLDMDSLERSCVRTRTDDPASLARPRLQSGATSWSLASGLLKVRRRHGLDFGAFGRRRIRKRCCAGADVVLRACELPTEDETDADGANAEEAQQHDPHRGRTRCDEACPDGR